MVALTVPDLPSNLQTAFFGAGALLLVLAYFRSSERWERFVSLGLGGLAVSSAYQSATTGSNQSDFYHYVIQLVVLSVGMLALGMSLLRAEIVRRQLASIGLLLFVLPVWWESVLATACSSQIPRYSCTSGFAGTHIRGWLLFVILLASFVLLALNVRAGSDAPPHQLFVAGLAALVLFSVYAALFSALGRVPPRVATSLLQLVTHGGAIVGWIMAGRSSSGRASVFPSFGLALFVVPLTWLGLQSLFEV